MQHYLDEFTCTEAEDHKLRVNVKGWAGADPYEIVIQADGKEICRFSNSVNRPDVCAVLGEETHDNHYGFAGTFQMERTVRELTILIQTKETAEVIEKKRMLEQQLCLHHLDDFYYMQVRRDRLMLEMSGWCQKDGYDVVLLSDGKETYRFSSNVNRKDLCAAFHEPVHDNLYGFKKTCYIDPHVNILEICFEANGRLERIALKDLHMNPDEAERRKRKKERKEIYRHNIETHPGLSIDRKNRYKVERDYGIPVRRVFDPEDAQDYNEWLQHQTYYYEKSHFKEVTFVIVGKKKVKLPFGTHHVNMETLDLSKIHTPYVCFVKDTCTLYPQFFPYLIKAKEYDLLYCDSDHLDAKGNRCDPCFKPDFSRENLYSYNYIGNVFTVRKELLQELDHTEINLYRYLLELTQHKIHAGHISRVLYSNSSYDKDARKVLEQFFAAHHIPVTLIDKKNGEMCEVHYLSADKPLISIIIPTKDHKDDLERCLQSIFAKTTYPNFEIIIIDNNSEKHETYLYFEDVLKAHANVHVYRMAVPFNFSLINNTAVKQYAKGEYVVLLNNDTEVVSEHWLEDMLGYCALKGVGTVGVRLLYPDGTLQHAGILVGRRGVADHVYYGYDSSIAGYGCSLQTACNVSGCTAACLMVKKSVYLDAGGMNEDIQVAFGDVDFMFRMLNKGYRNVFLPFVTLIHYESKSRGPVDSEEKEKRFVEERRYILQHWKKELRRDPYYNDNFDRFNFYKLRCRRSFGPEEDPDCY